jgi:myo-inositol-hexaphosphate 3-phosphohydrolase
MILYNITYKIDLDISEEWLKWMKQVFIPRMMETGKFEEHKLCQLMGVDESDGFTFALQFLCPNMPTFQLFQQNDAYNIQKAHAIRYKDKYVSFSTIMKVVN